MVELLGTVVQMADAKRLRILVIDDEVTQRMLVKEYLEEAGHVVRQADDGKRGLKMATTTAPDMILLDVMLPSIDGFDLCRSLKQHPATTHTPVILITASRDGDVIAKGLAAGADDFVTKPVDWNFLADRVEHVARKAEERIKLLEMVEARPEAQSRVPAEPVMAATLPGIEELMRSAERDVDLLAAASSDAIGALKSEFEADLARALAENQRLVAVARAAVQQSEANAAAAMAESVAAHTAELDHMRELIESERVAFVEREKADRASLAKRTAGHVAEVRALREAFESERRRYCAEIDGLKAETEALKAKVDELVSEAKSRPSNDSGAPWGVALRALNWQAGLAGSVATRTQAAITNPGRLDAARLTDLDRTAQALQTAITNTKRFVHAMATAAECREGPVNLSALVSQIAGQAKGIAANARVELRTQVANGYDTIIVDEARLRYAWICLVVNAIRFTPPGGHVTLEAGSDADGSVRLQVSDDGVGIAPVKLEELRSVLDVPPPTQTRPNEAAGLGVPMATALVRQMGGSLEINSQPGRGTRASLVFPGSKRALGRPAQEGAPARALAG